MKAHLSCRRGRTIQGDALLVVEESALSDVVRYITGFYSALFC